MNGAVFILADSQPLFADEVVGLLQQTLSELGSDRPLSAAYVGAGTLDRPEYFSIFLEAMSLVGISDAHMISSDYHHRDREKMAEASLVLLGGGDVDIEWKVMQETGMASDLLDRHQETVIVGVSAGAVLLGLRNGSEPRPIDIDGTPPSGSLGLVPYVVAAHDSSNHWAHLKAAVESGGGVLCGIGLPRGTGAIVRQDGSLQPLLGGIVELRMRENRIVESILAP